MPTCPTRAETRVIGPVADVFIVVGEGVTESPLVVYDNDETIVSDITIEGQVRTIVGAFWRRGTSITETIEVA